MKFVRLTITEQLKVDDGQEHVGVEVSDSQCPYRNLKCVVESQAGERAAIELNRSNTIVSITQVAELCLG